MKNNVIVLSAYPQGKFMEGIISGTPKPGTVMQIKAGVAPVGGRHTWEVYTPGTDGLRRLIAVLREDDLQGRTYADAYVSGTRGFLYAPIAGEELNMLVADVGGTADDHAIGDLFMVDSGTGKLLLSAGPPESSPFVCMETITDPVADQLVWCMYTGY